MLIHRKGTASASPIAFLGVIFAAVIALASSPASAETIELPGLSGAVTVYENADGIPTIAGNSDNDIAFVIGWVHASQRFFQMDFNRRQAAGTLSELVGATALAADIQLRTLGLGRAAVATYQASDAQIRGQLQAYANGVNAWLANNPLPPEYSVLEITQAKRWSPVDSLAIGKLLAFGLSFDLDIDLTISLLTYQAVGDAVGFDGSALFFEDTHRSEPMDGRVTVPTFIESIGGIGGPTGLQADGSGSGKQTQAAPLGRPQFDSRLLGMAQRTKAKLEQVHILADAMRIREGRAGSNWWVLGGQHTRSGSAMLMNDPHLSLDTPSVFNEMNLVYLHEEGFSVSGVSFSGIPGIVQGCNDFMCWGSTVHPMDVSDVFQEQFRVNRFGLPTHTVHADGEDPLIAVFQSFFANSVGDGEADNLSRVSVGYDAGGITFLVSRRNRGPVLDIDGDTGLSVAYTGWGPTFELKAFSMINKARSMDDFAAALQYFDVGSQNFSYADVDGNIAYFTGGENPIRSDLQAETVDGNVPPWVIRDGTGNLNHGWAPVSNPQPNQALPFEILPFDEMPKLINPEIGFINNANNDPVGVTLDNNPLNQLRPGGGIYYLNPGYADLRMGRIDRVVKDLVTREILCNNPIVTPPPASEENVCQGGISVEEMTALQANNQLLDAEILLGILNPILVQGRMAQCDGVPAGAAPFCDALDLLSTWDFSTPTGIKEGYDPGDDPNDLPDPTADEIRNSAAATVFAVFRSRMLQNTIDATLNALQLGNNLPGSQQAYSALVHHLRNFPENKGVGAAGIPFINAPGVDDPDEALATVVFGSLQQALDLLASDEFAPAFGNSTNPMDYRWGKLHRIVFDHPLGADPFNVPNGGGFTDLGEGLPGLARSGGYQAVDASSHSARADSLNAFMFGSGPARRFWGILDPMGIEAAEVIPGGNPGVFLDPRYASQLGRWLTNQYHPLSLGEGDGQADAVITRTFQPPTP